MIKYVTSMVTFEEIPTEVTLSLSISNCQGKCPGCHSPELRCNIGTELTNEKLDELITSHEDIDCVCFMGEGRDITRLSHLISLVKDKYGISTCLYTGSDEFDESVFNGKLDFIKIGHYDEKFGPLNKETTNQRMYRLEGGKRVDVTSWFWKKI